MQIDLDSSQPGDTHHATVCIVGGGIAGLVLAMSLARRGIDVNLLEAGGLTQEERSQALFRVDMPAERHLGATEGRYRTFGGSSTRWGGQLLPFTPDIFAPPAGSPSIAWPISAADLEPFYPEIERLTGVNSLPFTSALLPALGHAAPPSSSEVVLRFSKWIPFKQRNLAGTLGAETLAHPRVRVFTHANAAEFEASADDPRRIESVRVVNYEGRVYHFTAEHFVVCTGTIESSRLLLASAAVPNPHDQMGRYFHDHLSWNAARFTPPASLRVVDLLGPFYVDGTLHTFKLEASAGLRAAEHLLAVMAHVVIQEPEDSGAGAIRNLLRSLQRRNLKEAVFASLLPVLRGTGDIARLWFYSRFRKRRAVSAKANILLNIDVEQAPHAGNRVALSATELDAIGLPRAVLHWRAGDAALDSAERYVPFLKRYLDDVGLEALAWSQGPPALADTYHMMGGLRMGTDAAESVVDPNLKVHGVDNLHVASCAVFPSGSSSNPTFTLMALTLRLADRLAGLCLAGRSDSAADQAQAR